MKYPSLFIFLLLSQCAMAFAQDYLPILPGRSHFLSSNDIRTVDSISHPIPGYDVYHFSDTGKFCWENLRILAPDSIAIHKKNEKEFLILNPSIEPFTIPYQLAYGDTALMFESEQEGIRIIGIGQGVQEESFWGITDSVRMIKLKVYTTDDSILSSHNLHNFPFKLSKHYGALHWLSIIAFGGPPAYIGMSGVRGLTNPRIGSPGYRNLDIYDFYPGDEVHTLHEYTTLTVGIRNFYSKWKCISRDTIDNGQTVRIVREIQSRNRSVDFDVNSTSATTTWSPLTKYNDTSVLSIAGSSYLPWKLRDLGSHYRLYTYGNYKYKPKLPGISVQRVILSNGVFCREPASDFSSESFCFLGLGCYTFSWSAFAYEQFSGIVYYHKADSTWGTPLPDSIFSNAVSVSDPLSQEPIGVFPNPGTSIITLSGVADQAMIEVFDLTGKQVWRGTNQSQGIDLSGLSAGMYHIRLTEMNVSLKWRKE